MQQHLFSGEAKPAVTNWADTDDEDDFDDDIGPLPSSWVCMLKYMKHSLTRVYVDLAKHHFPLQLPTENANGNAEEKQEEDEHTDSDEASFSLGRIFCILNLRLLGESLQYEEDHKDAENIYHGLSVKSKLAFRNERKSIKH